MYFSASRSKCLRSSSLAALGFSRGSEFLKETVDLAFQIVFLYHNRGITMMVGGASRTGNMGAVGGASCTGNLRTLTKCSDSK